MARIIPVIDVMGGRVVRAVGGRRSEYKPLVSRLTNSTEPVEVARALLAATGAAELYLADLDSVLGGVERCNTDAVRAVCALGVPVWADAGLQHHHDETVLQDAGCRHYVLSTETAWGYADDFDPPGVISFIAELEDHDHLALSIDLNGSRLLGHWRAWGETQLEAFETMAREAVECGYRRLIVLDLRAVGERAGPTTLGRVQALKSEYPQVEVWTGGGIRDRDDIQRAADAGADAVLVASALHDGTLP